MLNMIQQQILQQQISTEAILEEIKLDEIIDNPIIKCFLTILALLISPFSKKKQRRKQQLYQNQLDRKSIFIFNILNILLIF